MEGTRPPAVVRRALRTEVGFGCPVDGCGSPYLTWHHFDPPWREREHHNPAAMVAMCLQHHKEADSGAFTNDQIRALKNDPFVRRVGHNVAGHFNWKREQLILQAGGGFFVRCPVFLQVAGRPMIWLSSDPEGNQLLNLDVWDRSGQLRFSMRDNDWVVAGDLHDVEAPPSARSLIVRDPPRDIRIAIEFAQSDIEWLRQRLAERGRESTAHLIEAYERELERLRSEGAPGFMQSSYEEMIQRARESDTGRTEGVVEAIKRGWSHDEFVVCSLQARVPFPFPVHVADSRIVLPGDNIIQGTIAIDCGGGAIALN